MEQIEVLLGKIPHRKKVIFAAYCCNSVKHLMNQEGIKCLELLEKWIEDNESVSMEELKDASSHIYAATSDATDADTAATAAAFAAIDAAYAAGAAADAAAYAADAADAVEAKIKRRKIKEYKTYLLRMIDELTPLEKKFI